MKRFPAKSVITDLSRLCKLHLVIMKCSAGYYKKYSLLILEITIFLVHTSFGVLLDEIQYGY